MRNCGVLAAALCALGSLTVAAQDAFVPEQVRVESGVGAGPKLYVAGDQRVHVIEPTKLEYKGLIATGGGAKFAFSESGDSIYIATSYYARGWTGAREDVLQIYDTTTLAPKSEMPVIEKVAMGGAGGKALSPLSSGGRYLYIQNATPATSVQVIDLSSQQVTGEIPTPGCWGIYPSKSVALRFTALCGDGKLATYTLNAAGSEASTQLSDKIFDAGADPLFVDAERDGDTLMLMSFHGNVYQIDIAGAAARLIRKFSITEGVAGEWAPGGMQVIAYLPQAGVLYVLMHDKSYDGSHTDVAKEVWAIDMKKRGLLSRSTTRPIKAIFATGGDAPALYAFQADKENSGVLRYTIDKAAGYTVREDVFKKLSSARPRLEVH
jgi:methylamine dehydrogenase heavy chain